jgi:uracil-DNA glycosylase family 4
MNKVIVRGVGDLNNKIALVGEAPGAEEIRYHQPFVGSSGKLLNSCLSSAGISRSQCYITNVIKERPLNNDIKQFIDLSKKQIITTKEYTIYEAQLKEELEECKANVIVAIGAVSLYALCRQRAITKRRGSIYESTLVEGKKIIPIIHPAAALRMYIWKHLISIDLERVLEESFYPGMPVRTREIILEPSFIDCMSYLNDAKTAGMIGYDIEIVNEQLSCISFAKNKYQAICIPFVKGGRDYFSPEQEIEIWKAIDDILGNEAIVKVGQNIGFDNMFMHRWYGIRVRPVQDTMVAQGITFPDFPKGLDFLTSVYTKEPYYKDEGKKRFKGLGGTDKDFWLYSAKDSLVLMEILPKQLKQIMKLENLDTYKNQVKLIEPLTFMGERGIRLDVEGMKKESDSLEKSIIKLREEVYKMSDEMITNPNSTKQLRDYFYITKGISAYKHKGTITTNDKALRRISIKGFREADVIREIRKQTKYRSTYLTINTGKDGRLRSSFNPVGTKTGRLSSSANIFDEGTNMENLPHKFMKYLLADEGRILYEVDLKQAENRIVAYIAPERNMMEAFESNIDIHSLTAALVFRKDVSDISNEDGSSILGNGEQSERFWGKTCNHALNYDMGYRTFSLEYELPESEAKLLRAEYHRSYPGVKLYHNWVDSELYNSRSLVNLLGRKRYFMDRWSSALKREAYNFIPQSTVADVMNKYGINALYYDQKKYKYLELQNQVHDSLVFQLPISIGWEAHGEIINNIKESLEITLNCKGREFIIPVACKLGYNLYDVKEIKLTNQEDVGQEIERAIEELKEGKL